ncbi:hypothetical protein FS837_003151 [Tulasnella sp. UAMH 9824]|nr:hypothetical protein FS837_003151 [Tulasnella sp. UAMH 9824]
MPAARKGKAPATSASSPIATTSSSASSSSAAPGPSRPSRARQDSSASLLSPMDDPSSAQASASEAQQQWTEPPWVGFLETTEDALLILEAARRRLIPRVTRRLADRERKLINSGSVFVFEEEESGIKRWTDGFLWSPSRILGNFLLYRETDKRNPDGTPATRPGRSNTTSMPSVSNGGASSLLVSEDPTPVPYPSGALSRPKDDLAAASGGYSAAGSSGLDRARERILLGSLTNSQKFKEDGMMKKTFSLTLPNTTQTHHIVSYYKVADVEAGRLRTPSSLPEFAALEISPEFLDKTHFRVQPRVEVGEDGRVRFRGETNDEPDSPSPEPPKDLPHSSAAAASHHHPSHGGSNVVVNGVPPPTSHGAHHSSHPYQRPQSHHGSSSAASHYSASVGSTNSYSGFGPSSSNYPSAGHHSRQNSISATSTAGSLDYSSASSTTVGGLAAAAKAQAEASARMYMNGAAVAAAASSSTPSSKQFHPQQAGYFPAGTGVGSTASSLGLHYPSALSTYNSSSASSSVSPPPPPPASSYAGSTTSHTSHSSARSTYSYDSYSSAYTNDNATGAPPFQAPQLYNPNQPSAGSNAQFATTSYPASLAPNRRASNAMSSTTPSVRSGMSMSTTTSAAFEVPSDAAVAAVRGSRSGSRGSDSSSISSGPGSLVSNSTAASSEVATPSIASSSRRSSAGIMSSRPDPLALGKMLAAVKPEQALDEEAVVVSNGYGDLAFDMNMMNVSFNGSNYGAMGMTGVDDTLGLGMDTMIMSPVQDVGLGDDQPPLTATWCGATNANGYDMSAASSFQQQSYIDQQLSQSPSHTSSTYYPTTTAAANAYSIPPPAPTRQKSMPSYPPSASMYGATYQFPDQQQQQYYQHPGLMRATTMYEPSATSFHGALGGEQ